MHDVPADDMIRLVNPGCYRRLEEWEETEPMGTRVLRKLAKNSKRKRDNDEC